MLGAKSGILSQQLTPHWSLPWLSSFSSPPPPVPSLAILLGLTWQGPTGLSLNSSFLYLRKTSQYPLHGILGSDFFMCLSLLSCYNKMPSTRGLNDRHSFLTVLEARSPKVKMSGCLESGKSLFPGLETAPFSLCTRMAFLHSMHMERSLSCFSYKDTSAIMGSHLHRLT